MTVLNPTPRDRLLDPQGRPYFLWDVDMTLDQFEALLHTADHETRAWLMGKLLRQAKPDDVFSFVSEAEIRELWTELQPYLGKTRDFWHWSMRAWEKQCLQVDVLQRSPAFVRMRCADGQEAVVVDLVAEPVAAIEPPQHVRAEEATIRIDTEHEIFVNKLGALLHRAEVRDLVDLRALLLRGADLARGLRDAATKDGGFSPLIVGHLLHGWPLEKLAAAAGLPAQAASELTAFRDDLARQIAKLAQP